MRVLLGSLERITWVFSLGTLLALGYLATPQPAYTWQEGPSCSVSCTNENPETEEYECMQSFSECPGSSYAIFCYCTVVEEVESVPVCGCN